MKAPGISRVFFYTGYKHLSQDDLGMPVGSLALRSFSWGGIRIHWR